MSVITAKIYDFPNDFALIASSFEFPSRWLGGRGTMHQRMQLRPLDRKGWNAEIMDTEGVGGR